MNLLEENTLVLEPVPATQVTTQEYLDELKDHDSTKALYITCILKILLIYNRVEWAQKWLQIINQELPITECPSSIQRQIKYISEKFGIRMNMNQVDDCTTSIIDIYNRGEGETEIIKTMIIYSVNPSINENEKLLAIMLGPILRI